MVCAEQDTNAKIETMNLYSVKTIWSHLAMALFLTLATAPQLSAQIREEEEEEPILVSENELNQLLVWYVDGKYEKVLYKAIRYTEDDKQKKHPVPYLYMAKSYLGIHNSDDNDLRETYEVDKLKALKNALKYAGKFVKKDKEQEYVPSEQDFFEELRLETIIAAETEIDNGKLSKAKSYYKYLTALDQEDPGAWMMYGTVFLTLKARRDADKAWERRAICSWTNRHEDSQKASRSCCSTHLSQPSKSSTKWATVQLHRISFHLATTSSVATENLKPSSAPSIERIRLNILVGHPRLDRRKRRTCHWAFPHHFQGRLSFVVHPALGPAHGPPRP